MDDTDNLCPICGKPVQRIVHAENETNYCATCQTNGKLLADRALSQLLKTDWPKTVEEWEQARVSRRPGSTHHFELDAIRTT